MLSRIESVLLARHWMTGTEHNRGRIYRGQSLFMLMLGLARIGSELAQWPSPWSWATAPVPNGPCSSCLLWVWHNRAALYIYYGPVLIGFLNLAFTFVITKNQSNDLKATPVFFKHSFCSSIKLKAPEQKFCTRVAFSFVLEQKLSLWFKINYYELLEIKHDFLIFRKQKTKCVCFWHFKSILCLVS